MSAVLLTPFFLIYGTCYFFITVHFSSVITFNDTSGYPAWCLILSNIMMSASIMFCFTKIKCSNLFKYDALMMIVSRLLNGYSRHFLSETDSFYQPIFFGTDENNEMLLSASSFPSNTHVAFGTTSFPLILDEGSSSTTTP